MINPKDISVVVQGPINKIETPKCLKSIRKYLPDAEIILSTWEGSDVAGFDFDKVIYNKDPGAVLIEYNGNKTYNNMNRQLLTIKNGLELVERKYALKLRSDLILTGTGFLDHFDKFQNRIDDYKLFNRKIVVPSLFTREKFKCDKNSQIMPTPFHITDWWFMGLTDDIKTYFKDTELVKEPEFSLYFKSEENINKKSPYAGSFRFAPEQYFGYSCFSRNFPNIKMNDASDYNEEINRIYKICLVNNFIVLDYKQSGIYLNKYPYSKCEIFSGELNLWLFSFAVYEKYYRKYCDKDYKPTTKMYFSSSEDLETAFLRLCKHIYGIKNPKVGILGKLEKFFLSIPATGTIFIVKFLKEFWRNIKNGNKRN